MDFITCLDEKFAALIFADIDMVAEHGRKAPVSVKPITGHSPLCEIRTGGYRTFFYATGDAIIVLHSCKKQNQDHGIKLAYKRIQELEG